ncbi:MAG: NAD-dependent epimerase/dehydratase family protein, partial [Actinomycetota bacterium]
MRVTITGGAGFLGLALAERLLGDEQVVTGLRLADRVGPPDGRPRPAASSDAAAASAAAGDAAAVEVEVVTGDLTEDRFVADSITSDTDVVYHLASVVSAGAEADFDLGYAVNLHGTLALLERCRRVGEQRGRP